jgi:outer membrane protein assembly factor BamB
MRKPSRATDSSGVVLCVICVISVLCTFARTSSAADWTHWRGPLQTGVSTEKDLPERWSPDPKAADSNLIWTQPYGCRSTPMVMAGRVFIINLAGEGLTEQERVMCFDANTGKVLWEHKFNVFYTGIANSRVGWTNLAGDPETGNVYAHGTQGFLLCFNRDGKVLWSRSLTEEYGRISGYGGRQPSPIVDGDLVIIGIVNSSWGDQARGGNRFLALDKRTGVPVWWSEPGGPIRGTYYSTPVVATINGQRLLISGGADGAVHAMKVRTGERVWSYPFSTGVINPAPVVHGNLVYIAHGEENEDVAERGRIICLDASKVTDGKPALVWENKEGIIAGYTSPILHDGKLYVCDDTGRMFCFDAASGKPVWKRPHRYGRLARGSGVWADGKIYIFEVNARFHILKPGPKGCEELHEQYFPSKQTGAFVETNGTPAVANGRVYFGTAENFYCIGNKAGKAAAESRESTVRLGATTVAAIDASETAEAKPTHLQIVPADEVARPGTSVVFKARTFDAAGNFLKEVPAKWSLPTPAPPPGAKTAPPPLRGVIDPNGKLTVAKELPGQHGYVEATAEGLTATARVRVASPLPIEQDFENVPVGAFPAGWVNTQGKYVVVERDGQKVLKKLANDSRPPLARANAFMGLPDYSDYTIEADLLASQVRNNLPDMGLGAHRYTLILSGNRQELRIMCWETTPPRVDHGIPFSWQPDVWYRMKLTVDVQGAKGLVRGKVWPRGKPEPDKWTIEFIDPIPNPEGSPALYGYATGILEDAPGAEAFYDNVRVTPNKK